jgi:tetratricopeptide (TPR) repeat protein
MTERESLQGGRQHPFSQPDLAREHLLQALRVEENLELQASILGALGYVFARSAGLSKQARLQSAIECHEKAAELYWSLGQLDSWAREYYNLGNTWCDLPESANPDKWREAIECYENALVVRTRDKNPRRYAATLQNLGTAYRELPTGEKGANVRKAIDCYRIAVRIYTAAAFPLRNAALHNNLGNAYLSLPETDGRKAHRNALRALRHFERALRVWTRTEHRRNYAIARYNSGTAMMQLAVSDSSPETCQREAAACFRDAAECWVLCGQTELAATA